MLYHELQEKLRTYNWDDGFAVPQEILDDPNCDLALALEIFYLADGFACLSGRTETSGLTQWKEWIVSLYDGIRNGRYPQTDVPFEIPLTRTAKYQFRKKQIPEVFLRDLP